MKSCTKVWALRHCLRRELPLPDEQQLGYTWYDWVLLLLSNIDESMREKLLLLWWRLWHFRNNSIFSDGKCAIQQSSIFLTLIWPLYRIGIEEPLKSLWMQKEKPPLHDWWDKRAWKCKLIHCWTKPAAGWAKLNFDAGFENSGSWGAALWEDTGCVLLWLWAWGCIPQCQSVEAIVGIRSLEVVLPHHDGPVHLENDCLSLISEINGKGCSKSVFWLVLWLR